MAEDIITFVFDDNVNGEVYLTSGQYTSASSDTPASTVFESRIVGSVEMTRSISTHFWGGKPRGTVGFSAIKVANGDGRFDYMVGVSMRDTPFVLKIGKNNSTYAAMTTVATGIIDRVEFNDEDYMMVYVKGKVAKLDRSAQTSTYPSTVANKSLQGAVRPLSFGELFQVPLLQPSPLGYGDYDLHENDNWLGITSFYDQGAPISEAGVKRSTDSTVFGVSRITQPANISKQCADLIGAFRTNSTPINETFTALTNWTETNGGVGGRDASISSSQLSMVNTAGGADLTLQHNTTVSLTDSQYAYFEFTVVSHSGTPSSESAKLELRAGGVSHAVITAAGKYRGIVKNNASTTFAFVAMNGCNCTTIIDNFSVKVVTPLSTLSDYVEYFATTGTATLTGKGPLVTADIGSSVASLSSSLGYKFSNYVNTGKSIAELLDEAAISIGGFWYEDRLGLLQFKQLLAPTGTPVAEFTEYDIITGMSVTIYQAEGLSDTISARRNYSPYNEGDLAGFLRFVSLSTELSVRRDSDVAVGTTGYTYTITGTGGVLGTADFPGGKYYWEVTPSPVTGATAHHVGTNAAAQGVATVPGSSNGSIAYRNDGQALNNGSAGAYGNSYTTNDNIAVIRDSTMSMAGAQMRSNRQWFNKNGVTQNSGSVVNETGFLVAASGTTAFGCIAVGANATSNGGSVNLGQSAFAYTIPDDYIAPAWLFSILQKEYRYTYTSSIALANDYAQALAAPQIGLSGSPDRPKYGTGTILSMSLHARTEQDRWNTLFQSLRIKPSFSVIMTGYDALTLEPGDLIQVTYGRYEFSAGVLMRITSISGDILGGTVKLDCWR